MRDRRRRRGHDAVAVQRRGQEHREDTVGAYDVRRKWKKEKKVFGRQFTLSAFCNKDNESIIHINSL